MAKRRRLTPAQPQSTDPGQVSAPLPSSSGDAQASGTARAALRPPIADIAGGAASMAALETVTQTLEKARAEGRWIEALPIDAIDASYLVRDRLETSEDDMQALQDSLERRGQQTPIEVVALGQGRWGLISGWRRLTALRHLQQSGRGGDTVLALIRTPADSREAYVAMVEENEIRAGLSYYERGRIVAKAVDMGVYSDDRSALQDLFGAASRPRRSKIGSFVRIVRALDGALRFPISIGERSGLRLARALAADPDLGAVISRRLESAPPQTAEAEADLVMGCLGQKKKGSTPAISARGAAPQVTLQYKDNRLVIEGALVQDPAFRSRLQTWLKTQGQG